jgi:hypothetical protein
MRENYAVHALNSCLAIVKAPGNNSRHASFPMPMLGILWARLLPETTPAFYTTSYSWSVHRPHARRSHRCQPCSHGLIARQGRRDRCAALRRRPGGGRAPFISFESSHPLRSGEANTYSLPIRSSYVKKNLHRSFTSLIRITSFFVAAFLDLSRIFTFHRIQWWSVSPLIESLRT